MILLQRGTKGVKRIECQTCGSIYEGAIHDAEVKLDVDWDSGLNYYTVRLNEPKKYFFTCSVCNRKVPFPDDQPESK